MHGRRLTVRSAGKIGFSEPADAVPAFKPPTALEARANPTGLEDEVIRSLGLALYLFTII